MRPKGSAEALEVRRRIAGKLLQEGKGVREVARLVGASPSSVSRWKQILEREGMAGLKARPHPGKPPKLSPQQRQALVGILQKGAQAAGFATDLWTLARVAQVIERHFGVRYHPGHVWRILRGMGWSPQKPERRARERDEEAIRQWREEEWPQVKKTPTTKAGASS
ncbi:IS630 family transposase [Candidatus Parcubacteria bacterium]|nr:MAG: IS630 family transposase [Candidatus Parcubacteria bacterium]